MLLNGRFVTLSHELKNFPVLNTVLILGGEGIKFF